MEPKRTSATAAIVTIGDEILIGQITDTNSAFISRELDNAGYRVRRTYTVGDDRGEIHDILAAAMECADIVIVTGGLGPTRDDITKKVLAGMFGCPMVRDRQTYERVREMTHRRGFEFNELNRAQADVPQACTVLPNNHGTAPGMWFERQDRVLVSLPGVPFEMENLMRDEVLPRLAARYGASCHVHRNLLVCGIAESMLAEKIAGWEDSLPAFLKLAYLPGTGGIRLRLSCYGDGPDNTGRLMDEYFAQLKEIIPENVVSSTAGSLFQAVAQLLTSYNRTVSVAESCTGGAVASGFTAMAGASEYFTGGVVAYSNRAKTALIGVPQDLLTSYGAVSSQVAECMARQVRTITGTDYGVATTGIAGPSGGSTEKPVGTVWIAVADARTVVSRKFVFGALRRQNIERAGAAAADMLRCMITEERI